VKVMATMSARIALAISTHPRTRRRAYDSRLQHKKNPPTMPLADKRRYSPRRRIGCVVHDEVVARVRLPSEAKILACPEPAEPTHRKQCAIPRMRNTSDDVGKQFLLDSWLVHCTGIRH
jgi:hypothetical protein